MQFLMKLYFILSSILDGKRLLNLVNKPLGMCAASMVLGAIMSLSIAPVEKWPFAVIALGFFMMQLYNCKYSPQVGVLTVLFFGTYGTLSLTWLNYVMEGFGQVPAVLSYIVIMGFSFGYIAFPYAFFNILAFSIAKKKKSVYICCFVPIGLFFADYVIYYYLTGFPWLYTGYSCVEGPLKNYAPFIGVRGINVALYVISAALALTALRKFLFLPVAAMILVVGVFLENIPQVEKLPTINASLVQANITQSVHNNAASVNEIFSTYWTLTKPKLPNSKIVVWSESALPVDYYSSANLIGDLDTVFKNDKASLVTGIFTTAQDKIYNSIVRVGEGADLAKDLPYQKRKLVPFGEIVPFEDFLRPLGSIFVIPNSSFSYGADEQQPITIKDHKFIPAICYEAIFPEVISSMDSEQTNGIIMVSNDSWFGPTQAPQQHLNIARMRAMELQKPMLRCTNSGITAYIDENGNVVDRLPQDEEGVLTVQFSPVKGQSFYSKYGTQTVFIILLLLFILGIRGLKQKDDPTKETMSKLVRP
jgi:apolipoprotein N-acyltransferase